MTSFSYQDLIACGEGKLFSNGGPPLPAPPMLMFDKIEETNKVLPEFLDEFTSNFWEEF